MPDKQKLELLNNLDSALVQRVARHYKGGAFEFDLDGDAYTVTESGTVYHVILKYADKGESVVGKLRRILARKLEEKE